jgi:catalase-peroxidase
VVPFTPGRTDTTQELTDVESFAALEPAADAFRNYHSTVHHMVGKAHMLTLTAPEMSVLVAGMRVLNTSEGGVGVLTQNPETLSNDFFVNLLDMGTKWSHAAGKANLFDGKNSKGEVLWTATDVDLAFGSVPELRAIAEHYACEDSKSSFVDNFTKVWTKVTNLDRFDVRQVVR